jgi:glycosyltransferase involved in cell wall biosynthesis
MTSSSLGTSRTIPVTIVMPGYNASGLIGASLSSLVGQTTTPAEVLVIDDCSNDRTAEEAERFQALLPLRVLRQETNQGPGEARRRAVLEASQPWIAALDADDIVLPNHLETLWGVIAGDHDTIAIPRLISWTPATSVEVLPPLELPVERRELIESIARKNVIPVASMFSRDKALAAGNYSDRRQAEDMELWLRMLLDGANVKAATTPTFVYRRSLVSNSTNILQLTEASLSAVRMAIAHGGRRGVPSDVMAALRRAEQFRIAELYWHDVHQDGRSSLPGRRSAGFLRAARNAPKMSLKESARVLFTRAERLRRR